MESILIVRNPEAIGQPNDFLKLLDRYHLKFQEIGWSAFEAGVDILWRALIIISDTYPMVYDPSDKGWAAIKGAVATGKPVIAEYLPYPDLFSTESGQHPFFRIFTTQIASPLTQGWEPGTLFEAHQALFLSAKEIPANKVLLATGKVVGVHKISDRIPPSPLPVLVLDNNLLACSTRFSHYATAEFRPRCRWEPLLSRILHDFAQCKEVPTDALQAILASKNFKQRSLASIADLKRQFLRVGELANTWTGGAFQELKGNIPLDGTRKTRYTQALRLTVEWFLNSGVMLEEGKHGVYEGFYTKFGNAGEKMLTTNSFAKGAYSQRGDCTMDTLMLFFLGSQLPASPEFPADLKATCARVTKNLLAEALRTWHYDDRSIRRGLFAWFNDPYNSNVFYADDNGRCALWLLLIALWGKDLGNSLHQEILRRAASSYLGLLRTQGKNGHRPRRIDLKDFYRHGGRAWFRTHKMPRFIYGSPHYEANIYAFLLLGALTFSDSSTSKLIHGGIRDYMRDLKHLKVEQSTNDDLSKLLTASAINVVAQNSLNTAQKNNNVILEAISYMDHLTALFGHLQDPSGAVPECDLLESRGCREATNDKYGTIEASVFTQNTDCITDQLYSTPFLAIALHFVSKAGASIQGDSGICNSRMQQFSYPMLLRLLDFLCDIQIKSPNPQLHGGWMRAFDYSFGEYYGSNGDTGWGAYAMETGWMVALIGVALGFVLLDLDPYQRPSAAILMKLQGYLKEEQKIHEALESDWRNHTPPAMRSPNELLDKSHGTES